MIAADQFEGGGLLRVKQGGDQPMYRGRGAAPTGARDRQERQTLSHQGMQAILNDAQGQGRLPFGAQRNERAAIAERARALFEVASSQPTQELGSPLLDG